MDEQQTVLAGTTIAAFALAQASFVAVVGSGLFSKAEAEGFLRQSIASNQQNGGPANRLAANLLNQILKNVTEMEVAPRH